ncbi:LacI family transcriptional regulator [Enterococcus sp. DIV2402]|uniref:LacI family transcriptional regulator n=1 Tax=Candidatus Enterococcus lowellii TaxID=2230877 RepID=A0ABZ2SMX0_9ENTE|nr:LacI family DNA-binding transcriptional regulator [Enterococcus sp. DIV2402]MBO0464019.1 LacI family DNA-binding transcriptional regulator [Enterococcus sp. DIV2402]
MTEKRMSIKELAKITGYSVATVSRVLNNKEGKFSEKTREKILAVIEETNYETNSIAKSLRMQRTNTVGVILPDLSNAFFARLVQEIETLLSSKGMTLIICTTNQEKEKEVQYLKMLEGKMVDGIIMISGNNSSLNPVFIKNKGVVFIDRDNSSENNISSVHSDHRYGGKIACQKLIANGCKKIAFVTQEDVQITQKIFEGVLQTTKKQSIKFDESNSILITSDDKFSKTGASNSIISGLIKENNFDYDGVICTDDRLAIGVILALQAHNKKVPEEVKVIGYGNDPIAKYFTPSLSSIRQDYLHLARESVNELLYRIENKAEKSYDITIPVSLINRQTTI